MTALLVIGTVGLLLVLVTLLFGDVLDGVLDWIDLDAGGGLFSVPVIGGFLAALGFGGALAMTTFGVGLGAALALGLLAGVVTAGVTWRFTRAVMTMATDATPRHTELVGKTGVVLTRVPDGGLGEVRVAYLGQQLKLSARADEPLPAGREVVVVAVTSPTSVVVTPVDL